jgi:hypothetical protein
VVELLGAPGYRTNAARLRQEMLDRPSPAALVAELAALAANDLLATR